MSIYGFTFAYHIGTHDYYQLPLIPILALSIAPLVDHYFENTIHPYLEIYSAPCFIGLSLVIVLTLLWQNQEYPYQPGLSGRTGFLA